MKRIGVLTSGGDAPGMNAAVRAVALVGLGKGCEVIGIEHGYRGLLEGTLRRLGPADVGGILREGGTVLGTARCPEFLERDPRDRARALLSERGIEGLVVVGGNGSLTGALALSNPAEAGEGAPAVIGIPASIDNDIGLTRMAIGVDTAMNTIVDACDKIADTATSHERAFLVEVMGRDCGYLAMASGIASGADLVCFPESHQSEEALVEQVARTILAARKRRRPARVLILVAEGVRVPTARLKEKVDARLATEKAAAAIETRVTVLGHVVRGGRPSAFDRLLASRLGNVAVRALLAGETRKMASWMPALDLAGGVAERSPADPHCWLVPLDEVLEETARIIDGTSPAVSWRARALEEVEDVFLL